ncbi:MAG: SCO family protein [Deltaproteobacteria bacterium]|nr:SCO family protein [Deltaproteobacteria bacterium]
MKQITLLIMAALIIFAGCSEKGHEDHSSHEQHTTKKAEKKKTAQIYENGRIVQFEETAPTINLTNQDGKIVTNEDLKGKVVLFNFIYTNCKESCPIMTHKFMDIEKEMQSEIKKGLRLISITMDPERDTPEVLKKHAASINANPEYWSFLTGEKSEVDKVLKGFRFFYEKNEDGSFGHTNAIVMLDRKGVWKYNFSVLTVPVDILVERVRKEF